MSNSQPSNEALGRGVLSRTSETVRVQFRTPVAGLVPMGARRLTEERHGFSKGGQLLLTATKCSLENLPTALSAQGFRLVDVSCRNEDSGEYTVAFVFADAKAPTHRMFQEGRRADLQERFALLCQAGWRVRIWANPNPYSRRHGDNLCFECAWGNPVNMKRSLAIAKSGVMEIVSLRNGADAVEHHEEVAQAV